MSETATAEEVVTDVAADAEVDEHHDGEHKHFSDKDYIKVAAGLGVLTLIEIVWPEIFDPGPMQMWPLILLMVVKFLVIASYFMHLKFDNKVLTRVFYAGLALAVAVYVAVLFTFTHGLNIFRG